jgi:hypothetical protein
MFVTFLGDALNFKVTVDRCAEVQGDLAERVSGIVTSKVKVYPITGPDGPRGGVEV